MPTHKTYQLELAADDASPDGPRLGGGALIGGVADWPHSPFGAPLVLVASLTAEFLADKAGIDIGAGRVASAFTTYSNGDYFLDQVTYHGDASELALLRRGTTQVLVHERGELAHGAVEMPARRIVATEGDDEDTASRVGGEAQLLQEEPLAVNGLKFALQIYGGDLPPPFRNLFYLTDAVGYLYLPEHATTGIDRRGLLFAQVT